MPCGEVYLTKQVTRDLINTFKLHLPFSDSGTSLAEVPLFDNLNEPSENPPGKNKHLLEISAEHSKGFGLFLPNWFLTWEKPGIIFCADAPAAGLQKEQLCSPIVFCLTAQKYPHIMNIVHIVVIR